MNKLFSRGWLFFVGIIVLFLYRNWFTGGVISGSDFTYIYPSQFPEFTLQPYAWSGIFGNGLGGLTLNILNLDFYLHGIGGFLVNFLHISWGLAYRLIFFWPFLIVGFFGAYYLGLVLVKDKVFAAVSPLIYLTNTYILMLVGGGQVGLMMAYAVAPYIFASFVANNRIPFVVSAGFLVLFDLRFSVLIFAALILYTVFVIPPNKWFARIRFVVLPMITVLALHSFWIIPAVFSGSLAVPEGYDNPGWLAFLSWAEFSKTISLLHPNWPENIFGKTYFMRPEFIILPVLAFIPSLLFRDKKNISTRQYYFFILLLLISAFLAKGVNPPFGSVYEWLFTHMPLFSGFRDPTKFYFLSAIAYTVLIPHSISLIKEAVGEKMRISTAILVFICLWGLLIAPLVKGTLGGTFQKTLIPPEYMQYERLTTQSGKFQRTLVVPWRNRFVINSTLFPAMDASAMFDSRDLPVIIQKLEEDEIEHLLTRYAIKYVVVPDDFTGEIFLNNRKYDPAVRQRFINTLDKLGYLKKRADYNRLAVYEFLPSVNHVYLERDGQNPAPVASFQNNPTSYTVRLPPGEQHEKLVFSERFDPRWLLWDGNRLFQSQKTSDGLNSYIIPPGSGRVAEIYFSLQQKIYHWQMLSLTALAVFVIVLFYIAWKASKPGRTLRIVISISMTAAACGAIIYLLMLMQQLTSPFISWSRDWTRIRNPADGRVFYQSRYEGSEMRFRVYGARSVTLEVSGIDPEWASNYDIRVDGAVITQAQTLGRPIDLLDIPVSALGSLVVVRTICSGSPHCALTIRDIHMPFGGLMGGQVKGQKRSMAILGDSISSMHGINGYGYKMADQLGLKLHNASVIGSTLTEKDGYSPGILRFEKDIVAHRPDVIIIALGANDLIKNVPVEDFSVDYQFVVGEIKKKLPDSQIVLVGLFRQMSAQSNNIESYNMKIQEISRAFSVQYIDAFGMLASDMFQDTLHPSVAAQNVISEALKKTIKKEVIE